MAIAAPVTVQILELSNGRRPFDEWFEGLSLDEQYVVENRLLRVRLGNFGDVNSVGSGVWELKFRSGRAMRIYYGRLGVGRVVLLLGGDKRTQRKDIVKARELLRNFLLKGK